MSKAEIIAELPRLSAADLADVQAKLDELVGDIWQDRGELTDADKQALDHEIAAHQASPHEAKPWADAKAELFAKFQK